MTPAPPCKIRVLCLHGYHTNARVVEAQTLVLQKALGSDDAEFVFLDAPFEATGPVHPLVRKHFGEHAPFREWFHMTPLRDENTAGIRNADDHAGIREMKDPKNKGHLTYEGIEESFKLIEETIRARGPFDVVVGFSQGAILLTLMAALYLKKHGVRLWRLAICVGGLRVMDPQFKPFIGVPETGNAILVPFSSVHIIGNKDPIHLEPRKLAAMYEDYKDSSDKTKKTIVYEHPGSYKFPSLKGNEVFYGELVKVIHEHSSADSSSQSVSTGAAPSKL